MNELKIFNHSDFGQVRTINESGNILFCGNDVARALGYDQPHKAIERHCRYGTKHTVPHPQSISKTMEMLFIPEPDLYRLVFSSKLPSAEKFTDWVTSEVLPSIRKHGGYITGQEEMSGEELMAKALLFADRKIKEMDSQIRQLTTETEQQKQIIADFAPKAQYLDVILSSTGTMATSQIAADYNMSAKQLNKILHEAGIQHNVNGQWILYRDKMGMGYTKSITIPIVRSDGRADTKMHTHWTQKGRLMIHDVLASRGIQATMDK